MEAVNNRYRGIRVGSGAVKHGRKIVILEMYKLLKGMKTGLLGLKAQQTVKVLGTGNCLEAIEIYGHRTARSR